MVGIGERDAGGFQQASPLQTPAATRYPRTKRVLDIVVGAAALVAAIPVLTGIRVAMLVSGDRGPFLFRARRIGEGGREVMIFKVRTMRHGAAGSALTSRDDDRVTRLGRALRRFKLDELPQIWNVLRGEMALVGPRPEDPAFVDLTDPLHRRVFTARPGITGLAQLEYRGEADLLFGPELERQYREVILPAKLALDRAYLERQSVLLDLKILIRTATAFLGPGRPGTAA